MNSGKTTIGVGEKKRAHVAVVSLNKVPLEGKCRKITPAIRREAGLHSRDSLRGSVHDSQSPICMNCMDCSSSS